MNSPPQSQPDTREAKREIALRWGMNALVCALFACIPAGLILAFWFNDPRWLWLCAPILIFLS